MLCPSQKLSGAGLGTPDFFGAVAALPALSRSITRSEPPAPRAFFEATPCAAKQSEPCPSPHPLFSEGIRFLGWGRQLLGFSINSDTAGAPWLRRDLAG